MMSPPARAAIERRSAALRRATLKLEVYDRTYRPLVAKLSETEFRSLYFAVIEEMTKRWPQDEGEAVDAYIARIKPLWMEKVIQEGQSNG
jgi:hypothetical protein